MKHHATIKKLSLTPMEFIVRLKIVLMGLCDASNMLLKTVKCLT